MKNPYFKSSRYPEGCTQKNNKKHCLSGRFKVVFFRCQIQLEPCRDRSFLRQFLKVKFQKSNFNGATPQSHLYVPCNFSILRSSHFSFFGCLFECSGSLGVIFLQCTFPSKSEHYKLDPVGTHKINL